MDFNEVVRPIELEGGDRTKVAQSQPLSEEKAIERLPQDLRTVYQLLRKAVMSFGSDVEVYTTRFNFIFRAGRVFAEIPQVRRGTKFTFRVRPEGYELGENQTALVDGIAVKRVPDNYLWTVNHQFDVTKETDLDAVVSPLRQSYDGARKGS